MKLLFFIPACLVLAGSAFMQPLQAPVSATVYVGTGRLGVNCAGTGICSIQTGTGQAPPPAGYKAKMGYDAQEKLFIEFQNVDLPNEVLKAQFSADLFEVQEDYPIPAAILQWIQSKDTVLTLKTGFYPLEKSSKSTRITFE